jgi:hypothetical protein
MPSESSSGMNGVVTSLKIAALATILGAVVLAAERQMTTPIAPEPAAVSASVMPRESPTDRDAGQASKDVPAPAPSAPVADQPLAY